MRNKKEEEERQREEIIKFERPVNCTGLSEGTGRKQTQRKKERSFFLTFSNRLGHIGAKTEREERKRKREKKEKTNMKKEPEREKKKERKKDNSSWSFGGLISPLVES